MTTTGLQVSTPTDTTIVMTREFRAPRRLVWEAMTRPDLMRGWLFSPPGWEMTRCEGDVRVGGRYRWEWSDGENDPALSIHGEYTEVRPPERLVHTETMEMSRCGPCGTLVAALDLEEAGGVTRMRMTLTFETREARDGALKSGMEHGMEAGYRTLDAQLAARV